MSATLYDKDFYKWALEQAQYIKTKAFDKLDIEHLIEEVGDMSRSEERELESRLEILLMHLLKWKYQHEAVSSSWTGTIEEQRYRIARRLKKMPSLKNILPTLLDDVYSDSIRGAVKDTGLNNTAFPTKCEWSIEQILDNDFYPN